MSKRKIEAALKRKGLVCDILEYSHQATPGEMVGGWEIELDEDSTVAILLAEPRLDFGDLEPDCFNTGEVLAWIDGLPDVKSPLPTPSIQVDE